MHAVRATTLSVAATLFALALALPGMASAQQQQEQQQVPAEVQQWAVELQQLQAQLEPLQAQALQEPEIQVEQAKVVEAVVEKMVAADPANEARLERMETLMAEAAVAREAGDAEKIAALSQEASELQPQVQAAQAAALADPDVQPRVVAFQQKLNARVVEIDPSAEQVIERIAELEARITAAMGGRS